MCDMSYGAYPDEDKAMPNLLFHANQVILFDNTWVINNQINNNISK